MVKFLILFLTFITQANAASLAPSLQIDTGQHFGSGWLTYSKNFKQDVIVTNAHVCVDVPTASVKEIKVKGLKNIYPLAIVLRSDTCILHFDLDGKRRYQVLKLSKSVSFPQKVISDGFPEGEHARTKHTLRGVTMTENFIKAPMASFYMSPFRLPGISGSPVLNKDNEVVSMIWGLNEDAGINLGVTWTDLRIILNGVY